jgi:mannose-6-phosphate isomerase-like protein (cupin superfamily)
MSLRLKATHVPSSELELLNIKVTREGGAVRYLEGAKYGLATSVYHSQVPPGTGPRQHTHPYSEVFVLHDGQGRFMVGEESFDAAAGDMVIVPPGAWHSFVNTGTDFLRQTAIHEAPAHDNTYRDDPTDNT